METHSSNNDMCTIYIIRHGQTDLNKKRVLQSRIDAPSGSILISTHAIAMKGLLEYLTPDSGGSYWGTYIKNCDIYVAELENGAFTVPTPLW